MFTLEHHTGRLAELWRGPVITSDEYNAYVEGIRALSERLGTRLVVINDCRLLTAIPPSLALSFRKGNASIDPCVERSAILLSEPRGSTRLHLAQIYSEPGHRLVRIFDNQETAGAWLGEVLTPEESARLATFLASKTV